VRPSVLSLRWGIPLNQPINSDKKPFVRRALWWALFPLGVVVAAFFGVEVFIILGNDPSLGERFSKAFASLFKDERGKFDVYESVFTFGILGSLYAQSVVTFYFDERDLLRKVGTHFRVFTNSLIIPMLLGFSVLFSLLSVGLHPFIHVGGNIIYLAILAAIDLAYWLTAVPREKHHKNECDRLKRCCRDLFLAIDIPSVFAISVIALIIWIVKVELPALAVTLLQEDHDKLVAFVVGKYFSGVIGYHLILSCCLIAFFLLTWEKFTSWPDETSETTAPVPSPTTSGKRRASPGTTGSTR
jgi:hypothetical protein